MAIDVLKLRGRCLAGLIVAVLCWIAPSCLAATDPVFVPHKIDTVVSPTDSPSYNGPQYCSDFDVVDINGDGHPDVVACSKSGLLQQLGSGFVIWLENDGQSPPSFISHPLTLGDIGNHSCIKAADMNGDGYPDVLTDDPNHHGDLIWYENGGGLHPQFTPHRLDSPSTITVLTIRVADFNGDHRPDIVVADGEKITLYLIQNCMSNPVQYTMQVVDYARNLGLQVADFNGDGRPDLLFWPIDAAANEIDWYENLGGDPVSFRRNRIFLEEAGYAMKVMDVDKDGRPDILVRVSGGLRLLRNNGDNPLTFTESVFASIADDSVFSINDVGDLNLDGKLDLIGTNTGGTSIYWYENPGDPTIPFIPHLIQKTSFEYVYPLALSDLNGDGGLDLVAIGMWSDGMFRDAYSAMYWYENSPRNGVAPRAWALYE